MRLLMPNKDTEIETIIKLYEEIEEYEICAGMYAALKIFKQVYDGYK